MRIDFTGRQMEVTPELRHYTAEHLRKLTRLLGDRYELHVILTAEKHRRVAEITTKVRDHTMIGIEETDDIRSSISGALGKLEKQAVRLLERKRTQKRRSKPTDTILVNVLRAERLDNEERRVVQSERIPIKPMTVGEAIEALDATHAGAVVFRNPNTERVNVIYQRPDGNLGLIEPEP